MSVPPSTGFFVYKRIVYFAKEYVVLGGIFWGGIFEKALSLDSREEIIGTIESRLNMPKPVIDDPDWKFPSKINNSVYEAMGFSSWRKLHQKAIVCGVIVEEGAMLLTVTYPGSGYKEGDTFELNCGDDLELLWDEVYKHYQKVFALEE